MDFHLTGCSLDFLLDHNVTRLLLFLTISLFSNSVA